MALDKLVDSARLDTDLASVADAIRAKTGGSGSLAFPAGFVSAIGAIAAGGIRCETGSFTLDEDTNARNVPIPIAHGLGAVPELVLVWTEDYSLDNLPEAALMGGFLMVPDLFCDLPQRLSSTANSDWTAYVPAVITAAGAVNLTVSNSNSYFPTDRKPTASAFYLPFQGASTYWRAGVTYRYFVAGGWRASA